MLFRSELRSQARTSVAEVSSTAKATRRTLTVYQELGREGIQRLALADADLRANTPRVLKTLADLDAMSANLNRLIDRLSKSWLLDLLSDPSRVPDPLGPPAKTSVDPASGSRPAAAPTTPPAAGASTPPAPHRR